ncbi:MAG: hypothetical protein QI199_06050, partial [Candidatus Korarchaeota archaeon]|nr:hypothetical protein [Candidatus Korarchaeota archaeon]
MDQRIKMWHLLNGVIDGSLEPLSLRYCVGAFLSSKGLDYFDSLIAAQCLVRGEARHNRSGDHRGGHE